METGRGNNKVEQMGRYVWAGLAALAISACQSGGQAAERGEPTLRLKSSDLTGIGGKDWAGTLTYLDYGSGKNVAIAVEANVTVKGDCMTVALIYPDEPEANDATETCISENGAAFGDAPLISLQRLGPDFIAFQTETGGEDDGKPARIRQNYILSHQALTSGKEVSFDGGETWLQRNEFDMERASKKAASDETAS